MNNNLIQSSFKYPLEAIKYFFMFLGSIYFFPNNSNHCYKGSDTYHYAHSLSDERLKKIYMDLKAIAEKGIIIKGVTKRDEQRPMEFEDINYTRILFDKIHQNKGRAIIRLKFCMDQAMDLVVSGINSNDPVIELVWGELEIKSDVLWQMKLR